jgi:hypothetical protein
VPYRCFSSPMRIVGLCLNNVSGGVHMCQCKASRCTSLLLLAYYLLLAYTSTFIHLLVRFVRLHGFGQTVMVSRWQLFPYGIWRRDAVREWLACSGAVAVAVGVAGGTGGTWAACVLAAGSANKALTAELGPLMVEECACERSVGLEVDVLSLGTFT